MVFFFSSLKLSLNFYYRNNKKTKIVYRFSSKGFSHLAYTSCAILTASSIPAFSKPLTTDSFCYFRYPYISTIHFACRAFKSLSFNETLTSPGAFPFINCLLTLSAYHSLNLLETYFFAFWLIVKSSS